MIRDLIGARIPSYDLLPGNLTAKVQSKGKTYEWGAWADHLEPAQGTTVLATYADQFYAGTAAAVTRKLGRGSVTYVGVDTLQGELERDVLRSVFQAANVPVQNFPDQFLVDWREGFWVATNFTSAPQTAPVSAQSKILTGTREVPPGGVTIWMEP
jgi:beta-galactosidase